MIKQTYWLLAGVVALGTAWQSSAATILVENFDPDILGISSGTIGGNANNWTGGTNRLIYSSTNLTFTNDAYVNTANTSATGSAQSQAGNADTRGAGRFVSSTAITGEVWFSALHRVTANPAQDVERTAIQFSNPASFTPTNDTLFGVGYTGAELRPVVATAGTVQQVGTKALALNTTYLIVAKAVINADASDSLDVWFFAEGDTINPSSLGTADLSIANATLDNFTRVWIGRQRTDGVNGTAASFFDALMVGSSLSDVGVIPEPASLALLGLGGLLMLGRSRKR